MRRQLNLIRIINLIMAICFVNLSGQAQADAGKAAASLAPGYRELGFRAPEPGSYRLPVLGQAADGHVLDSGGTPTTLHTLMASGDGQSKLVLLTFIYSTCNDVNGCPLATAVFHKIKARLTKETEVAGKLTLLTLSFNPAYDTPQRMRDYGVHFQGDGIDWRFLTTRSEQELQPILKNYRQTIEKVFDAEGKFTNTFNHSLRVFLIDQNRQIRNIYNTELLHADTVINDVKTLLAEAKVNKPDAAAKVNKNRYLPGDDKRDYENKAYQTRSAALAERRGSPADLLTTVRNPPLGLPPVPIPQDNPVTAEKIALGRKLFYDRRLSINNTFSCAMCHVPEQGFTSNEMATAVGVEGRTVRRNSPTLYNVAYQKLLFHDGRENTLENQVWGPFLANNEMANPSIGYVIDKVNNNHDYYGLFEQAFGKPAGMETIGMAIASYERALNSANSPFDRWYFGKDENAIDAKAKHGFALFTGKAGCSQCHTVNGDGFIPFVVYPLGHKSLSNHERNQLVQKPLNKEYALFTDHALHNTGIGYAAAMADKAPEKSKRVQVAPGVFVNVPATVISSVAEAKPNDLGRYEISQHPQDRWKYKTPTLRNISLTAPYMHDGSLATLKEVVEFYNRGGIANENLDPLIKSLRLTNDEINDLLAFLATLTGDNVAELVSDAYAAPIGDSR